MKKIQKVLALCLVATLSLGALAGCGNSAKDADSKAGGADDKVIKIGASPSPHEEILNAAKDEFEKDGYKLEIVPFTDYVQPNLALDGGELDANYFQHKPYLDNFNEEKGTKLVSAGPIHYEPMALFAGKSKNLDNIKDGAKIAVPNDVTNEARALLLLQDNGLIKLKKDAGIKATKQDIVENPHNIDIVELEAAQIPRSLADVDFAVINGNFAISAGLNFAEAIAKEEADSLAAKTYANIIAVKEDAKDSEKTKEIMKVLTSEKIKKFIADKYKGSVVPSAQ